MKRFAEGTKVEIEQTRAEMERLLRGYGADAVVMGWDGPISTIAFRLRGRHVRYTIERPSASESVIREYPSGKSRPAHLYAEAIAAEYRRRWRALLLIVKAKLEVVASGDSDFEDEFLSRVMLPDGSTVREWIAPQMEQAYESGQMPGLVPGASRALSSGRDR